ncbi:TPA: FKBP-type peptidyl-prolyl cis-trans isomerase [Serratia rubidaea]|uniref:FKBP-type peptidyl-prolyl cis-trans isomerase N-terminal domain-containing protein n=1 Tax=Serratia rubidaea TaxID=61652 RepID=UPI0023AF0AE4|nr:FKBP-type peptidyl-prolyl cis-trans isomerase N-terminal domain-containing protein [Serratia rubidaea]MDK1705120.1 FKBP-type peptidyl-prolyl cis-trans isomerase N-terminal domain-containing protein [Serratia rubidaea]HDJ1439253.1 FKBP-type peptidyl-prolyl cis-trans isomerase [Serratia rubidaea]HDJ1449790.1 FKBP-type peptidyl-prolyl cis-trans isomerase [Serratia rubidaea]HDJ1460889.1 FKBP-type peptidyl-prolyl cis-trans isomerase [Serratia rubidaea]HDJ2772658.1 FKBP-type peptidyl-prolyl cis-t
MKARLTLLSFCLLAAQASAGGNAVDNEGLQTLTSITQQNSDIPALLNYAERTPVRPAPAPTAPAVKNGEASRLMKTLREQQAEMGRQEKTIAGLRADLQALKQRPPANDAALQQVEKLQQALQQQQTSWQQQKAAIADTQQRFTQAEEALQGKERELQASRQQLAKQHAELSTLAMQVNNGREQREAAERRAHDSAEKLAALQAQLAKAKQPPALDSELQQQAYAVGASLGGDMLKLLADRAAQGVSLDRERVLAGVNDAFSGKYQLDEQARNKALYDSAVAVNQHQQKEKGQALAAGKRYLADFKKKGAKSLPDGAWYRIEYAGSGKIEADSTVDVVIKESLPDGTVISDMEHSGKVLSQRLDAYPAVFRAALGKLENHGSLQLVVPPEQAYGERGLPPKIPPGATMIYQIRIVNVQSLPADKKN